MTYRLSSLAAIFFLMLAACDNSAQIAADQLRQAEQGNPKAQYTLGVLYYNGKGLEQDLVKAHQWIKAAAAQHHKSAQLNLGMMYYKGEGVARDVVQAYKWLWLASMQKAPGSTEALHTVSEDMSQQQIGEALELGKQWLLENVPSDMLFGEQAAPDSRPAPVAGTVTAPTAGTVSAPVKE